MSMTADSSRAGMGALSIPAFTPFPTDCLPELTARYVRRAGDAINCDESLIALPLITAMASAIGNTRVIELKPGWQEPSIVWTAIVGESGTHKTPSLDRALWSVNQQQKVETSLFADAMAQHEFDLLEYEDRMKQYKRSKNSECPVKPIAPAMKRLLCQDITVEALAMLLADNPRGIQVARDELSGWVSSFDAYKKQGSSGDAAQWLQMYNGKSLMVDRKSGDHKTIFVPHASVCITGGIQPGELAKCLGQRHFENGLAARMLMCMPPRTPCLWTDSDMPDHEQAIMDDIFHNLWQLTCDGEDNPVVCRFSDAAKQAYIEFHDQIGHELTALEGHLAAAWSKLRGYVARFALVLQLVRHAEDGTLNPTLPVTVDDESTHAAIELVYWFGNETRRIYQSMNQTEDSKQIQLLMDLIQTKGGMVTLRQAMRNGPCYKSKQSAVTAFERLEREGYGEVISSHPTVNGGRPSVIFRANGSYGDGGTVNQPYSSMCDGDAA